MTAAAAALVLMVGWVALVKELLQMPEKKGALRAMTVVVVVGVVVAPD